MSADPSLTSGIQTDELDPSIRPQDDLFRHVNGSWIQRTEIPSDKARYGSFYVLAEDAEKAVRDIIDEAQLAPEGTEERKFGDLYASFQAIDRIEALGGAPLMPMLAEVDAIASVADLLTTLGSLERQGTNGLFQLFVDNDPGNPERYLVFLEQGGIGLPDESYFRDEKFAEVRTKYQEFLERMFSLAKLPEASVSARRVFELETQIASHHWDNVRSRDSEATYNLMAWADVARPSTLRQAQGTVSAGSESTVAELVEAPDLGRWLTSLDPPAGSFDEIVVRQPSFIDGVTSLFVAEQLESWKDWLRWQVIRSFAPYLSSDFVDANFDFYGKTLTGTPELRERWKRGVSLVEGSMGEAVGRIYVDRHFSSTAKASMDVLVENLVEAYRQSITELHWMTDATRQRALQKLEKFTPKIGFPVKRRDYGSLQVDPVDLIANVRATSEFEFQRELGKIGKPLDRDEWFMTPQTINAYYNPGFNEIVFPAAILQFPFFDEKRDAAANYGAIGAVIGHEIGHGFDDQGSKYDGDGRLTDWWTADDRAAFEGLTASLIEQYNALAPQQVPGNFVNGALTIGENIGDLGGLGIAWKAYLISLDNSASERGPTSPVPGDAPASDGRAMGSEGPPVVDGMSGAKRFFLSWAQAWQLKARDQEVIRLLSIDPHSPNEFRCNQIVRNIDAFYETFDVTPHDELWLDPNERVTIW